MGFRRAVQIQILLRPLHTTTTINHRYDSGPDGARVEPTMSTFTAAPGATGGQPAWVQNACARGTSEETTIVFGKQRSIWWFQVVQSWKKMLNKMVVMVVCGRLVINESISMVMGLTMLFRPAFNWHLVHCALHGTLGLWGSLVIDQQRDQRQ